MPRQPINYANSIIYKIVCKDISITDLYVGHTTSFTHRKREHKSRCINKYSFPIYKTINDNGGWDNWEMIEIEKYSCNDANEARARERYWYEELSAKLNARSPTLNIENKKEKSKEYLKNYHQNLSIEQKQKKTEYGKIWKKTKKYDCVCGAKILSCCKNKHFKTKKHIDFINS
jgi:hypothetical protein